jgi:hypothetical protein
MELLMELGEGEKKISVKVEDITKVIESCCKRGIGREGVRNSNGRD